jgi:Lipase (class 3)
MTANGEGEKEVLMKLTEKCLAQSNLIFLVADLRLLSATGRINTNFEALCLDSDSTPRMTSETMAGFGDTEMRRGITPRHVMAIVLLEMHQSWTLIGNNGGKKPVKSKSGTVTAGDEDEDEGLIQNLQLGHQDRFMARKADGGLHCVLRGYVDSFRRDLVDDIPKIPYSTYTRRQHHRAEEDSKPEFGLVSEDSISIPEVVSVEKRKSTMRLRKQLEKDMDDFRNVSQLFFQNATDDHSEDVVNASELETVVADAIKCRDREQLDFLPTFFVPNSITRTIAESEIELVWLNDWHPLKECTYGISVNRKEKTIMVAFRGAITRSDWHHVLRWWTISLKNPIEADYPNKHHLLKLHRGFYRYLFRVRKDTHSSKYDEIAARIAFYGKRLGKGFRVIVTGHSLGAALSTIFSFFASLEERFTRHGPIQVVNFGSPKVAAYQFADAVRHQEDIGKLQIARFHNTNDVATHLPGVPLKLSRRGSRYYHVGLDIQLPYVRNPLFRACTGGQPQPRVRFYDPEPWMWSFVRQWKEIYALHVPVRFWKIPLFHTLIEHQSRLHLADENHVLRQHTLQEFYEMRDTLTCNKKRSLFRKR